jgi:hypothetical protein
MQPKFEKLKSLSFVLDTIIWSIYVTVSSCQIRRCKSVQYICKLNHRRHHGPFLVKISSFSRSCMSKYVLHVVLLVLSVLQYIICSQSVRLSLIRPVYFTLIAVSLAYSSCSTDSICHPVFLHACYTAIIPFLVSSSLWTWMHVCLFYLSCLPGRTA